MNPAPPPSQPAIAPNQAAAQAPAAASVMAAQHGTQALPVAGDTRLALDWGHDAGRGILCGADGRSLVALKSDAAGLGQNGDWNALRALARDVLARSPVPVTLVRSVTLAAPALPISTDEMERTLRDELGVADARVVGRLEACVRAESLWGALRGEANWLFVLLDGDISGAVCVDGHVLRGANGLAGGLGGLVVEREGAAGSRSARGSLEAYCSVRALMERARSSGVSCAGAEDLWRQAAGDWAARAVCEEFSARLAQGVANAAALLNPSRVVIAGGLGGIVTRDLPAAVAFHLAPFCAPEVRASLQVLAPHFGADAAVMGAIAFAVEARS